MIDQIKLPVDFKADRKVFGTRGVAAFVGEAAFPPQSISHKSVVQYIAVGLLRPAQHAGLGSRPGQWVEGQIIEDLAGIVEAVEVAQGRRRHRRCRWSRLEIKQISDELRSSKKKGE